MPGRISEAIEKGFLIPWPMIRNFFGAIGPLTFIIAKHPGFIKENMPYYRSRLKQSRKPWAHLQDESKYDSSIFLCKEF